MSVLCLEPIFLYKINFCSNLYILFTFQDLSVREMKVHTTVGDMQLDNQEFSSGGYDFPVVLLMQKPRETRGTEVAMSLHARTLVDKARSKGSAASLTVVVDVNSHANIG